jgi:excinuclease ABC subunit B
MSQFKLHSKFKPTGDQPKAIHTLVNGVKADIKDQTLLGVTGSGKTFTMANVIEQTGLPTLVLSHNKTLAAQLFTEFKEFFPENHVEYFVSYYDYYQPEAYVARRDLYIEKEADINENIEKYRSKASQAVLTQKDVIIVATVSCIYGIGNPEDYMSLSRKVKKGQTYERQKLLIHLHDLQYKRSDYDFAYGQYRVRGDIIDINDADEEHAVRLEFFGDEVEAITIINSVTGEVVERVDEYTIFPAKQYVTMNEKLTQAIPKIREDLEKEVKEFKDRGKLLEAERLLQRTNYDLEMLQEVGYTSGIENYSRYIEARPPGSPPSSLLDYFPKEWLMIIDESHITVPQVGGMYNGDKARKESLIQHGFRMQAAKDNRPLKFREFEGKLDKTIYVSATPAEYEIEKSKKSVKSSRKTKPDLFEL